MDIVEKILTAITKFQDRSDLRTLPEGIYLGYDDFIELMNRKDIWNWVTRDARMREIKFNGIRIYRVHTEHHINVG